MRVATRLLLSHLVLAAILAAGVTVTVLALTRVTSLVSEIQRQHLGDLGAEEQLHRSAWEIEVAIRHGVLACEQNPAAEPVVAETIRAARNQLARSLEKHGPHAGDSLRRAASGYQEFADRVLEERPCGRASELSLRRLALDEELTNAWIGRMHAVRLALEEKEGITQKVAKNATVLAIAIGFFGMLGAGIIARHTARVITSLLASLSAYAHKVGDGDFSPVPPIAGPYELRALWLELDSMRAKLGELDQLKQSFVASVSHDLRTPLARLREALALLADGTAGPLSPRQDRLVTLARIACEREIRMVTALLDLSRVRAGKAIKPEAETAIDFIIGNAVEGVLAQASEVGVEIDVVASGEVPRGSFDAPLIERAVMNLLANAITASRRGDTVSIERRLSSVPGPRHIEIFVRDSGPGIAPHLRSRLFEPFGMAPRGDGIGLGLSLASEMIQAHGGEILLVEESRPGATFLIRVPLEHGTPSTSHSPSLRRAVAP
jgi:two-component system, NtrC family, sensor histidine kinase GlrK